MQEEVTTRIEKIETDKIIPDPENLRVDFNEEDIKALADNILEHGQMDPIQVFKRDDNKYQIFDGERRWRASNLANIQKIDAIIIPKPSKEEFILKRISRAMQSRSLTPQEEVCALEDAFNNLGIISKPDEWSKAARKLGLPPQLLRDRMRIARLSKQVRNKFEDGELDLSAAQAIGRIENQKRQEGVASFIKENQLHTRFVGTKFIEKLLQYPERPIIEVYTIAQSELRDPKKISHKIQKDEILADRLEDILADLRRAEMWMESSGREGLMEQLMERNDRLGITRVVEEVQRLIAMCSAFLKHSQKEHSEDANRLKELSEGH